MEMPATIRLRTRIMKTRSVILICCVLFIGIAGYSIKLRSQQPSGNRAERFQRMSKEAESLGLVEPFKGVTTNGSIIPGLSPIRST